MCFVIVLVKLLEMWIILILLCFGVVVCVVIVFWLIMWWNNVNKRMNVGFIVIYGLILCE